MIYNKLVRDNIPNIIKRWKKGIVRVLEDNEYLEELVDVDEVIHVILEYKNVIVAEYQTKRISKK